MQCAGDDWWLPEKLSIQVDFMETHPDIGMCYGKAQTYIDGKKMEKHYRHLIKVS